MYDRELASEIVAQILMAIERIEYRFEPVDSPDFFMNSQPGLEKLDAICLALVGIGESIKNLDKVTDFALLRRFPDISWKQIKGIRDILSHHYFDIDAEIIYQVCKKDIPLLKSTLLQISDELA